MNLTPSPGMRPGATPLGDYADQSAPIVPMGDKEAGDLGLRPLTELPVDDMDAPPIAVRRPFDVSAASAGSRPPAPPSGRVATLPPSGARTYYCRWCGMESETADQCSWCRRDMRSTAPSHGKSPAILAGKHGPNSKRGPVRQPVVSKNIRPAPAPPPATTNGSVRAAGSAPAVPQIGTFTAQKSKYYSDKVMDPVSGAHYDADTGQTIEGEVLPIELEEVNLTRQLIFHVTFLIVFTGIVAAIAHAVPTAYLVVLGVSNFIAGMVMPLFRTTAFAEDDSEDLPWLLGLSIVLGPFVGAILYAFVGMVKGGVNPGVVGVFVSYLVLRITIDAFTGHAFQKIMPFADFDPVVLGAQAMILITLAGWYAAAPFRKPDES